VRHKPNPHRPRRYAPRRVPLVWTLCDGIVRTTKRSIEGRARLVYVLGLLPDPPTQEAAAWPHGHVRYIVNDVDEAIGFYCRKLGFPRRTCIPSHLRHAVPRRPATGAQRARRWGRGGQAMPDRDHPAARRWNRFSLEVSDLPPSSTPCAKTAPTFATTSSGHGRQADPRGRPVGNPVELFEPTRPEHRSTDLLALAVGLVVAVGPFAFVDAHVMAARPRGEAEEEAGFGLHVGRKRHPGVGDYLSTAAGDRPDVEVGSSFASDEAVRRRRGGDGWRASMQRRPAGVLELPAPHPRCRARQPETPSCHSHQTGTV